MKFDRQKIEAVRPIARFLENLSEEDFVLHGSPRLLDIVEPRQADGDSQKPHQSMRAVYASSRVDIALVHALVRNEWKTWGYKLPSGSLTLLGENIRIGRGYLYILPRERFRAVVGTMMFVSDSPVEPLAILEAEIELIPSFNVDFESAPLIEAD